MHRDNMFLTLTYRDADLPPLRSLQPQDLKNFRRRLRRHLGNHIRFFACGEYGNPPDPTKPETYPNTGRPHFHMLVFGARFKDLKTWKRSNAKGNDMLYRSEELESLWDHGFSSIGNVTWQSAAYTARYIMKKVNGDLAPLHYATDQHDPDTGEIIYRQKEFIRYSNRPGLGRSWFEKYWKDVYPGDFVVSPDGKKKLTPPEYYDKLMDAIDPDLMEDIRDRRQQFAAKQLVEQNTDKRLRDREAFKEEQIKHLERKL